MKILVIALNLILLWPTMGLCDLVPGQGNTVRNTFVALGADLTINYTGITLENCTIVGTATINESITAKNCIFFGDITLDGAKTITATNCCFMQSKAAIGSVTDTDCLFETDPLLVDDTGDEATDYMLTSSSPCVDAGTYLSTVTIDYFGDNRPTEYADETDIGADERRKPGVIACSIVN